MIRRAMSEVFWFKENTCINYRALEAENTVTFTYSSVAPKIKTSAYLRDAHVKLGASDDFCSLRGVVTRDHDFLLLF